MEKAFHELELWEKLEHVPEILQYLNDGIWMADKIAEDKRFDPQGDEGKELLYAFTIIGNLERSREFQDVIGILQEYCDDNFTMCQSCYEELPNYKFNQSKEICDQCIANNEAYEKQHEEG